MNWIVMVLGYLGCGVMLCSMAPKEERYSFWSIPAWLPMEIMSSMVGASKGNKNALRILMCMGAGAGALGMMRLAGGLWGERGVLTVLITAFAVLLFISEFDFQKKLAKIRKKERLLK